MSGLSGNTLSNRIIELENWVIRLRTKLEDMGVNTEEKDISPYTIGSINKHPIRIGDVNTNSDGSIVWNDSELNVPPKYLKPSIPQKGYNKHFHTRYAGGALDINSLEIVEYAIDWESSPTHSKHSQQYWGTSPEIAKVQNSENEIIEKIGTLDLVFDANSAKWGAGAYEIDVRKCYFVMKDENGDIELDEDGNEKRALIYNIDDTKTNIVWDKTAKCFRFYAVYAEVPPTP